MSEKKLDAKGRFRGYTTTFRMSFEEHEELNKRVALSGLEKQEYMIQRALDKTIVVKGNMRMNKALRNQIDMLNDNLCKYMESGISMEIEELKMMKYIVELLKGLSKDEVKEI
ncbi:MAG: hypothetical protein RR602_09005 [Longicatena sp.]|uniref:plasmid mobilization protein n=1 Tax=Anaerorhabdus sp. TaxID=1872524 RepID=UPI002FCCB2AB